MGEKVCRRSHARRRNAPAAEVYCIPTDEPDPVQRRFKNIRLGLVTYCRLCWCTKRSPNCGARIQATTLSYATPVRISKRKTRVGIDWPLAIETRAPLLDKSRITQSMLKAPSE